MLFSFLRSEEDIAEILEILACFDWVVGFGFDSDFDDCFGGRRFGVDDLKKRKEKKSIFRG